MVWKILKNKQSSPHVEKKLLDRVILYNVYGRNILYFLILHKHYFQQVPAFFISPPFPPFQASLVPPNPKHDHPSMFTSMFIPIKTLQCFGNSPGCLRLLLSIFYEQYIKALFYNGTYFNYLRFYTPVM